MSSQDSSPNGNTSNLRGSQEGFGVLGIARCDPPPAFEQQERIFDQMPVAIQGYVIVAGLLAVFSRRNLWLHALLDGLFNNGIAVVTPICLQMRG